MEIEQSQKVEILLNLLDERYNASHEMRNRSTKFAIWLLGFVLVANGWLIVNGHKLSYCENILISLFITFLGFFAGLFIEGIRRGFNNNRDVIIKLEDTLDCYEVGAYKEKESIYPPAYKDNGGLSWFGHFETLYMWIISTYVITILIIWN